MADTLKMLVRTRRNRATLHKGSKPAPNSLGVNSGSIVELVRQVREGFPYRAIVHFQNSSGLSIGEIADLIRIPQRTLMRRKANGRLEPEESERLLRVSSIFEKAVDLFEGDTEGARRWLTTPIKELDNNSPLEFSRTEIGAREVEDLIGRLDHGVFT